MRDIEAFLVLLILTTQSFGQERFDTSGVVRNQVAQLVQAKYGARYDFHYVMFDAEIQQALCDQEKVGENADIQDPYGTLKGCILFSAYKSKPDSIPTNFIVGMIKHDRIIWDNFPGSGADLANNYQDGTLLFSQDINKDGRVDLVFGDARRFSPSDLQPYVLWIDILSWDGKHGKFISGDMIGSGGIELLNIDTTGIEELRVKLLTEVETTWSEFKTSSFPYVTYGWNGSEYGLWPNVKQYAEDQFLPKNISKAQVHCEVTRLNDSLVYAYSLSNERTSVQGIDNFYIQNANDISSESAPESWSASIKSLSGSTGFFANYSNAAVAPGKTLQDLKATSLGLPAIVKYYLQGYTGGVTCCPTDAEERENIFTNSVSGYTIGTRDTTVQLSLLQYLDTLISDKDQSVTLGWLRNDRSREQECEETMRSKDWYMKEEVGKMRSWEVNDRWDFDKDWNNGIIGILDRRLEKAKQALTKGDSAIARRDLQIFMMEVELVNRLGEKQEGRNQRSEVRDQKPVMTSEAYALLKYNAEYLIERLPEREGKHEGERNGKR